MQKNVVSLFHFLTPKVILSLLFLQAISAFGQCPDITPVVAVSACDSYALPAIVGTDLTGTEAYYTASAGGGTQFFAGDNIVGTTTLFIYDQLAPGCEDEETFTITIDNTPPIITCPADLTALCSAVEQPSYTTLLEFTIAGGFASDDISLNIASFTLISETFSGPPCASIATRTYQIMDDCGHISTCQQIVNINDNVAPIGVAPPDVTVQCIADVPPFDLSLVFTADACTENLFPIFLPDMSDGNGCPETITRTYSVTDDCGNVTLLTQIITVNDDINPTASNPPPASAQCISAIPPDPLVVTDEADNCSVPVVAFVSDVSDGGTCPEIITRTYSVSDDCGNQILVTQIITIDDDILPTASAPAPLNVQCIADVPAPNISDVNDEADNCTVNPLVVFVGDVSDGGTCPEIITRTYSVTDDCGNQILVSQIITVDDNILPTATAPAPLSVQCLADVPAANIAIILDEADNCTINPQVAFVNDVAVGVSCPIVITRTYSVTDDCGNQILVTQIITVDDNINPTASNPAPIIAQCLGAIAPDITVVTDEADNCSVPLVAFVGDVSDGGSCPEVITRTYSVTDDCGNQILVTQTITINDDIFPTASNPAPLNVQCITGAPVNTAVVIDEADNCGAPVVAFVSDVSDGGSCPEIITRTYSVTDACGNQILVTQIITVNDNINPTASNPAAINVQCIANVPASNIAVVTDEADNCSVPVVAFVGDVSNGGTCPEIITRTYSVTDACGNQILVTQTITVDDNINPTANIPAPISVQCIGDVPAANIATITGEADNCTINPVVAFVSDVSNGGTCPEIITRTYSVTDDCGNQLLVTQIITVDDNINPTASNPAPISAQCLGAIPPDITVVTDEADNCTANPIVAFVSDVNGGGSCPLIITRTYSVTDNCGNQILVTQTITIDDNIFPTASNPAPLNVQCITGAPVNPAVVIDEADNCGVPVVAFVSDVSNGGTCPEIITRTYSVTDACNNQILVTQTITVNDITPPTASNPAAVNVQCIANVPAPNIAVVTDETDNCSVPVVAFVGDVSNGGTCPEIITRTYSVTDLCGNQILVTQIITVDDNINPTASNPAPVNAQCIANVPAPNSAVVTDEADNCSVPVVAFVGDVSNGGTCPEIITRTYSVTDLCGNQILVTQTITVDDNINPTASNLAPLSVQCIADIPAPNILLVNDEADNCTVNPVVAFVNDVSVGASCPIVITRTYSVTDNCGNQILVTQVITVDDNVNPTASNPAPVNVQCIANVPAPNIAVVIDEADNCSVPIVAFVSDVSNGGTCPEIITRTYSVTDECGNQILVTQTITVDDDIFPTASNPLPLNVQCIGGAPVNTAVVIDEADNCGPPIVAFVNDVSNGGTCPEIITRTYSVTDACGNQILVTQIITVDDDINPTASNPAAVNVQCIGNVPAPNIAVVTDEADNCSVPIVAFVGDVSNGGTCPEIIARTYSVTDLCGNQILVTQIITVDDNINPTASNPAPINAQCIANVPAPNIADVTDEADNCSVPVVAFVGDVSNGGTCPEIITRTYSVTDLCGNQILVTQTITVDDNINPTASNLAPLSVQCIADIPAPNILLVNDEADNCTVNPVVAFVNDVSVGASCPIVITRTYSVTDNCGNQILVTQVITVDDNVLPTASNPAPINVQCIGDVPANNIAVVIDEADNCSVPIVAFVSDVSNGGTCPEIITRTYSVTDECGNVILVTQIITVDDDILPTASNPAPINVQCIADVPASNIAVVIDEADNCAAPVVAFVSQVSDGNTCPEIITRTYSVTDNCGNQILVTQTITVNDNINPTASNPAAVNVQCIADVPAVNVAVVTDEADNCSVPIVAFVNEVSDGNTCPEIITRTYSVTDLCGNQILVTQTITVDDNILPTATAPAPISVQCIADVPAIDITLINDEADNCTANPIVAFVSDVSDGNTCPEIITRTYSVTDDCGNQLLVTQIITVDDNILPTATAPAPVNVQCIADVPVPNVALIIDEADNCTVNPLVAFVSDVTDGNTCPEIITRTYSVTDNCGNQLLLVQTITVLDDINPTASNPAPINAQCLLAVPPDPTVVIDESDNCNAPVVAFVSDVSNGGTCPEIITRTYSVTDACGNQILVTQLLTINDDILPTASNPAPINVQCIADVPVSDITVVIDEADNCGAPVVAFVNEVSDGNTCPEIITRTYSVTDNCSNQIFVTQTITVDDNILPTATAPAPINVQCIADVPAVNIGVVTDEADNCSVPLVAFVNEISDGNTCPETITRTYSVTDDCGNQILVAQIITVDDDILPTATAPAAINVQCFADVPAFDITLINDEADNCTANPIVAFVSDVAVGVSCPIVITRTYSVTDDCGNQILVTQTITVNDNILPTASAPAPVNVQCIADVPASDITIINDELDNCTINPVVAFVGDVSDGNTCPEIITRTYSVTDECGNQILVSQIITVDDNILPTASAPAPLNVQCIAAFPPDVNVIIDETDNCGLPNVAFVSDVSDGNSCPEIITRTYSVTDACGNQILVSQIITVDDDIFPTATSPAPLSAQCLFAVAPDVNDITDEADNCGIPLVAFVSDVSDGNTCPEIITRTYSVTDNCGNQILVSQIITINDDILPTASNPAPINVQCVADVPAFDITVVADEADNCTVNPLVAFVSDVSDGNTCPEIITRTYSVTDNCGNQILVTQIITVDDDILPTASAPAPINVQCIADVPAFDITVVIDELDNCTANPVVAFVNDVSDGNTCPEIITRTYSITDDCGNQILVTQIITVDDDILPTASAPAPINVQCIADVPAFDITVVIDELDNCTANPLVAFVSDVSDGNTCPEIITRTYSITDDCGNQILVTQIITVDDDILPTATAPVAINVQCIADVPAFDITLIVDEADNCTAAPIVAFVSDVSDLNTCPETITRTYSVTDDCGNQLLVSQNIIVFDDILPTATAPAPINVQCIADIPAFDATLVTDEADNCTAIPTVAFVSDVSDGNTCPEIITRTYSITDDCGNQFFVAQIITVLDDILPTATAPAAINVQCLADVPAFDITVVTDELDNCTAAPLVAFVNDVSDGNTCPEIITRTYSVTDDCGNQILVSQIITVMDDILPTATAPAAVNVQCLADVPVPDITVVIDEADNCTINPTVAFVNDLSDGNTCPEIITRTYSITDDCGNQIFVTQTITVNDDIAPVGFAPADISILCSVALPPADITTVTGVSDNCTIAPVVNFVSEVSDGNSCPETLTRTYRISDDCGNSTDVIQTITIFDDVLPTASNPIAMNFQCIGDVPPVDIAVVTDAADNCGIPVVAFVSEVSDGNTCPEIITRIYSVTDNCGNQILVTQIITVNDNIPPTASNPANISVIASTDVPAPNSADVIDEADNCTPNPIVAFVSDVSDGNVCNNEIITRTYSITDDCGNVTLVTQLITITALYPDVQISASSLVGCPPVTITFYNETTPPGVNCEWTFDGGANAFGCDSVEYTYTTTGTFDIGLTVTNAEGCTASVNYDDYIFTEDGPIAAFTYNPDVPSIQNPEVVFTNESLFANAYEWNFGDNSSTSFEENPIHVFPPIGDLSYLVSLIATNNSGCPDTAYALINVENLLIFYVPNVFTPDGDDYNQTFFPVFTSGYDPYDYHLTIFNRWGEVIFESFNADFGWDGTYSNNGLVQDGVYVWQLEFGETMTDKKHIHRGHVTVLK